MSNKIWLYNLIPLIIHITLLPIWLLIKDASDISLFQMVLGTFLVPIYLNFIYYKYYNQIEATKLVYLLLMTGIIMLGHYILYFNWGISTGYLFNSDSETILIMKMLIKISLSILVIGWVIACLFGERKTK